MTPRSNTLDLLTWIATQPRTYDETIETWKTSCPRLSVWEDAVSDGLVAVHRTDGRATVTLTPAGSTLVGVAHVSDA